MWNVLLLCCYKQAHFQLTKNKNTVKVLVGITPSRAISFVSQTYECSILERKLVDKLEAGDELMAEKGFLIQDLLTPIGMHLNIKFILGSRAQMPTDDVLLIKKIARLHVHVEKTIGHIRVLDLTWYSSCSHVGFHK